MNPLTTLTLLSWIGLLAVLYGILQIAVQHFNIEIWDLRLSSWLISHATVGVSRLFEIITNLGRYLVIRNIAILITIWLLINREWVRAAMLVFLVIAANLISRLLQRVVERDRPDFPQDFLRGVEYSFPSGHTMLATAFYLMVIYLTWVSFGGTMIGWTIIAIGLALIVLVGISRIYLGVHFTTDVLGGWIAGLILFFMVIMIGNLLTAYLITN